VPQNQADYGLSIAPQNRRKYDDRGAGHTTRFSGLLHVEASWARVFQFASKLVEARRCMVHVALSRRLRREQVEDGRIDAMS
jgi:hypothetical protein